jgi:DNA-binding CsgD family transcriptional regulator
MYMSSQHCRILGEFMTLQQVSEDVDVVRHEMGLLMLQYLNADTYTSMLWNPVKEDFERAIGVNETKPRLEAWNNYYRFIDPVTAPMMARRQATTATQVISPQMLLRTEFFNDFLRPHNQHWGINIYFYKGESCLGDFRIWRKRTRGDFDKNDAARLNMLSSSMAAWLDKKKHMVTGAEHEVQLLRPFSLKRILCLSERETEIALMIGEGYTDKRIASEAGISVTTVRFHLKNIFHKCHVTNRAGVASRVQSLKNEQYCTGRDISA